MASGHGDIVNKMCNKMFNKKKNLHCQPLGLWLMVVVVGLR